MNTQNIDAVKALDGKIFAILNADEQEVLDFYRRQGRKFGVQVEIVNMADPELLSSAKTQEQADHILKSRYYVATAQSFS